MLWTNKDHQFIIFRLLSALMKVHPIPHAILKPQIQGLFQFCINVQCHERLLLCIYVAQTLYTLDKKSASKRNVETFEWLSENSPNCSCHV